MFLPSTEATIQFTTTGEKTKQKYEGGFKIKCLLDVSEDLEVQLRYDSYVRGSTTIDRAAATRARAIAELEVRVVDGPIWFKDSDNGRKLLDKNVILELALFVMNEGERIFDERIAEAAKKAEDDLAKQTENKKKSEKK